MPILPRIPQDRIAVLIGVSGQTRRELEQRSGAKLQIDSKSGDVSAEWGEPGSYDPIKFMKLPNVIKAIGRGMPPARAISLLNDDVFFSLVDISDWVGKRANQQHRVRARLIGTQGRIRKLIERHTGCELTIHGRTVAIVGSIDGLPLAEKAVSMLLDGAEHGSVIQMLERQNRRQRLRERGMDWIALREDKEQDFADLVPGLSAAREHHRRLKSSQVDADDPEAVAEMLVLAEDESIDWTAEE